MTSLNRSAALKTKKTQIGSRDLIEFLKNFPLKRKLMLAFVTRVHRLNELTADNAR